MKQYRLLSAGTGLLLMLILVYHVSFTLYHSVFPLPETFGRETKIAATASGLPPEVDNAGRLVYLQGDQLVYLNTNLTLDKQIELPDASLKSAVLYRVLADKILWLSDGELHMAELQGLDWGPVETLGNAVAFDAAAAAGKLAVAISDDRQVRLQLIEDGRVAAAQQLAIQDGAMLKADFSMDGYLKVAVISDYGTTGQALWWAEWDAERNKMLSQVKAYSFQAKEGRVTALEMLNEQDAERVICLVKEGNRADGKLLSLAGHFTQNQKPEPLTLKIMEQGEELRVENLGKVVVNESGVEVPLIVRGTVYRAKLEFSGGLAAERISAKNRPAGHPLLLVDETASQQAAVWVAEGADGGNTLYGTRTDQAYLKAANRIREDDVAAAIKETGGYLSGFVFAVAASLKWLVLPYLWLLARKYLINRFAHRTLRIGSHRSGYWVALGLYIISKLLTLKQFYSPQMLLLLPLWAHATGVRYLLPLAVSGIVLFLCRTAKGKTSPASRFTLFALIDIGLTAVWFGYYIR